MFRGMWKDETGIGIQWGLHKAMAIRPVAGRSPFVRQASVWPELTAYPQPLTISITASFTLSGSSAQASSSLLPHLASGYD